MLRPALNFYDQQFKRLVNAIVVSRRNFYKCSVAFQSYLSALGVRHLPLIIFYLRMVACHNYWYPLSALSFISSSGSDQEDSKNSHTK
jgi:hypothetical protein